MTTSISEIVWQLVYSEVSPLAYTFTGAWTNRWLDFSTKEAMTAEELVEAFADAKAKIEEHGVILSAYLYQYGTEDEGERWFLDITAYPRPDVYSEEACVQPSWFWPFIAGIVALPFIGSLFGKGGSDGGGGTSIISLMMPMMMMFMMMFMMMPMMSAMTAKGQ